MDSWIIQIQFIEQYLNLWPSKNSCLCRDVVYDDIWFGILLIFILETFFKNNIEGVRLKVWGPVAGLVSSVGWAYSTCLNCRSNLSWQNLWTINKWAKRAENFILKQIAHNASFTRWHVVVNFIWFLFSFSLRSTAYNRVHVRCFLFTASRNNHEDW